MIALARLNAGVIWWAATFSLLYALHGVGCAGGWAERAIVGLSLQRAVLLTCWAGSIAVAGVIVRLTRPTRDGFLPRVGRMLAWVGLGAVIVTGLPVVLTPTCV